MKRFNLTIIVCALSFYMNANAISFIDSFQVGPTLNESKLPSGACTDFSGNWKGVCKSHDGKSHEEAFTIKQEGCEMISLENPKMKTVLPVGGTFSASGAIPGNPAMVFGANMNSSWNKEKNLLTFFLHAGGKKLVTDEMGKGFLVQEDVKIANGKLLAEITLVGPEKKKLGSCEFDKQP